MNPVIANPLLGVLLHGVGAAFAATCYTPQRQVRRWSWQTYWLTQAAFCWFLLPIVGAVLTIPDLAAVLREAPSDAMRHSFLLGAAYGIGGTAFGISIRYIGFSLTYAIAVGLSSVLGTLIPPLVRGTLGTTLSKPGAEWVMAGIAVGALGIAVAGFAGRLKEKDLATEGGAKGDFSLVTGLALSLLAGVLSAVYGFALEAGQPIADTAVRHGAGMWQGNVIYLFSNSGAFLTTAAYCLFLHRRDQTLGELVRLPPEPVGHSLNPSASPEGHASSCPDSGPDGAALSRADSGLGSSAAGNRLPISNWALAVLTGVLWYGQFFFYNLGHVRMGHYKFTSWAIHMIMLVLLSNLVGVALSEWRGCRQLTHRAVRIALAILVSAVLLLTFGNYRGEAAAETAVTVPTETSR